MYLTRYENMNCALGNTPTGTEAANRLRGVVGPIDYVGAAPVLTILPKVP
jgi:hypothetical protein